jgi:putative NADH-flavin reductase
LNLPNGSPVLPHVPEAYQTEARAMKADYQWLRASDIDWTFFAPALMIAPGDRKPYRLGTDTVVFAADGSSQISAEDYAAAMLDEVEHPANRKSIMTIGY